MLSQPWSSYSLACMKFWPVPLAGAHDIAKDVHSLPDIHKGSIQWAEAKAQDVRRPEVSNDFASNQGLHDGVAMLMPQTDLAAANGRVSGTDHAKA